MRTILDTPGAGTLHVDYVDDWRYGTTAYEVKGPRVAGVFVVVPHVITRHGIDPDSPKVAVEMGRGDRSQQPSDWERDDPPTVYGVRLTGVPVIDTARLRREPLSASSLGVRRELSRHRSMYAAGPAATRAADVVDALLVHWLARPENYALRLHAAQAAAAAVREGLAERMRRAVERYAEARSDINELERQLARLDQLDAIAHVTLDAAA